MTIWSSTQNVKIHILIINDLIYFCFRNGDKKNLKNTNAWFMQKKLCAPRQIWLFCLFLTTKFDWKKIKDY